MSELLSVRGVRVSFDGIRVLESPDLTIQEGELRFLIGPNGAGKTTLLDVISGKTRPQQGTVLFGGAVSVLKQRPEQLARHGLARKFQTPSVFPSLTVAQNLALAASERDRLPALLRMAPPQVREVVAATLAQTGLELLAKVPAGQLAHGQQQWLEIGMLLVQRPRLLLLDEPVAGLTRAERERTADLLQGIAGQCALLIVEHDMAFVRRFQATVTVLHRGSVLTEGPLAMVQQDARVIDVYLGRGGAEGLAS